MILKFNGSLFFKKMGQDHLIGGRIYSLQFVGNQADAFFIMAIGIEEGNKAVGLYSTFVKGMIFRKNLWTKNEGLTAQDIDGSHLHTITMLQNSLQFLCEEGLITKSMSDKQENIIPSWGDESVELGKGKVMDGMVQKTCSKCHNMIPLAQSNFNPRIKPYFRVTGL